MSDESNTNDSSDPDAYRRLAGPGQSETKVDGSRFLGRARPVDSEEAAQQFVEELRSEHYDARHVCYGLRVGHGAARIDRSNDDGEPPRTGGFPIWQVLSGEEIEDSLVVVIRYFGGTKLGMGGLKRAYRDAAIAAIDDAGIDLCHPESTLDITVPYGMYDELEDVIDRLDEARIQDRQFTSDVQLRLAIWKSAAEDVRMRLSGLLNVAPAELDSDATSAEGPSDRD